MYKLIIIAFIIIVLPIKNSYLREKNQVATLKCSNDTSLFKKINNKNLLYLDSLNIVHLKLKNKQLKPQEELSDCQKLPFIFIRDIVVKDSVKLIKDIIDVNSFKELVNSEGFFNDKNNVYVFQESPATYPPFLVIDLIPSQAIVFNEDYIKDNHKVYFRSKLISNNASQFKYISNKENLNLFADGKNIIWNWNPLNYKELKELSLPKRIQDSLQKMYFNSK